MDSTAFIRQAQQSRLVAVIRSESPDDALERAGRALDVGVELLEIAWTTPNAAQVISAIKGRSTVTGAGTVLTREAAQQAIAAGAEFVLAPNFSAEAHDTCRSHGVAYIPGVFTPQDVARACAAGLSTLKLFPAASGGISHLRALGEPFPGLQWIPTGGVSWETVGDWLQAGAVAVGMGSALFRHANLRDAVASLKGDRTG